MKEECNSPILFTLAIAMVCIGVSIAATGCLHPSQVAEERVDWNLTLIGDGEKVLLYNEIRAMQSHEGHGGFFSTVGIVNGPFKCRGAPLEELCDLVGGINTTNTVRVSAPDGYLMVFTYDQVRGDFVTYDPATMKEIPHRGLTVILMYEQDETLLSETTGGPFRIAIVSEDEILTEGHYWVQWVNRIEIQ
ncbi:MAG: molybdopterin-binding oxidoreductase [Euryarchaeota archaeon]|nr:molybdopterin-binding oxidoreductase [Euryarchaeota archaeon]